MTTVQYNLRTCNCSELVPNADGISCVLLTADIFTDGCNAECDSDSCYVQVSLTVRISCLQFVRCVCSRVTSLDRHLSATYLVDLYSHLIGQLQQQHRALCSDRMQSSGEQSCAAVAEFSDDVIMAEMTLASIISVFDVYKFNSCLQQLLHDVVRSNINT